MTYWEEVDPPMSFIPEGWSYEQKRKFRYNELDYLHDAVRFEEFAGKRVLCIGDGGGLDAIEFARNGANVSVVDMSDRAVFLTIDHVKQARQAGLLKGDGRVVAARGDACDLPTWSTHFDAVYSFGVIHHIPDVERAVSEIARSLRLGGMFLGMVYHRDSLYYAHSILARARNENISPEAAMRRWSERNPGCPHSIAYTRQELHALLRRHFVAVSTSVHYDVVDTPDKRKVRYLVDDPAARDLGWHLFFRATK